MASVDDRKETSLRACIAHMLDIDVSEVPKKRETNMGQWLALRNLGLVPVASPESFEWPGRFLGLRGDSSTWAVFFGVPPGIIYDPLAESDEEKQDAAMDAAFVLAKHDPRRGTEPGSGTDSVGVVELIALASEAEDSMRAVSSAEAVEDVACWATATSVRPGPSLTRKEAATISHLSGLKRWRSFRPKTSSYRPSKRGVTSS